MSANQMRLLYLCIIQIFNQMTTLQENINIKQTLTVAVTQSNKDTEIVLKETTTVDVTIKEENQVNNTKPNEPTQNPKPPKLPSSISHSGNSSGQGYQMVPITGKVEILLKLMSANVLKQIDDPELTTLTATQAWHKHNQQVFSIPTLIVKNFDYYWIITEAKDKNGKFISFYTVVIQETSTFNNHAYTASVFQGDAFPPGTQFSFPLVLMYLGVQPTNEQFLQIFNKNLPGILKRINNPQIKTLTPTNVWMMDGYFYMNAFNYWIWLKAVNNDGTKGNSYSVNIFYQKLPEKNDYISGIYDGLVQPIGGPVFPRVLTNNPPIISPYTQVKSLDIIKKIIKKYFINIAQIINFWNKIDLTELTVVKAWTSQGPLYIRPPLSFPKYIYYWVWLQGTSQDGKIGNYSVELLIDIMPIENFSVIQSSNGQLEPPK